MVPHGSLASTPVPPHRWLRVAAATLLVVLAGTGGARSESPAGRTIRLAGPVAAVIDGDTFDADLDGDGRVDVPRERVRLLYVDTPELHPSPKGQDVAHGLPAKAALEALLRAAPLELTLDAGTARDAYGRTLARVKAGGADVSLDLVRQGHSYFDTRFGFPPDYEAFAQAEGEAFDARRGIWGDPPSRGRYLKRLRQEHKTPRSRGNRLYVPGVLTPEAVAARPLLNRYVTVEGTAESVRPVKGGGCLLFLRGSRDARLAVYASRSTERHLGLCQWPVNGRVRVEGFCQQYKDRREVLAHFATKQ